MVAECRGKAGMERSVKARCDLDGRDAAGMVRVASEGRFSRVGAGMEWIVKVTFDWVSSGLDGELLAWNGRRGLARTGELRKCRIWCASAGKERDVVALLVGVRTAWFG